MDVVPHSPTSKPSWLVEQYEGKMPCLVDDNQKAQTESRVITNHLEEIYPMPSLTDSPNLEAAEEAATPVFMAFARYCKTRMPTTMTNSKRPCCLPCAPSMLR